MSSAPIYIDDMRQFLAKFSKKSNVWSAKPGQIMSATSFSKPFNIVCVEDENDMKLKIPGIEWTYSCMATKGDKIQMINFTVKAIITKAAKSTPTSLLQNLMEIIREILNIDSNRKDEKVEYMEVIDNRKFQEETMRSKIEERKTLNIDLRNAKKEIKLATKQLNYEKGKNSLRYISRHQGEKIDNLHLHAKVHDKKVEKDSVNSVSSYLLEAQMKRKEIATQLSKIR